MTRSRVNSSRAEPPLKGNTCIPLTGRSRAARQGAKQLVAGVQYGSNDNTSSWVRQVRPPPMPFFRFQKILRLLLWNNRWKSHRYQGFCPPLTDADTSIEPSSTHRMRTNTHPGHEADETPGKHRLSRLAKEGATLDAAPRQPSRQESMRAGLTPSAVSLGSIRNRRSPPTERGRDSEPPRLSHTRHQDTPWADVLPSPASDSP